MLLSTPSYLTPPPLTPTLTRTKIVKIGNSQGIRIPKLILEQLGLVGEVELEVKEGQLVIRSIHPPRQHWAEQFALMATAGDDQLLDADLDIETDWDKDEWVW